MSRNDQFDPALEALLNADRAPPLPAGFADRVVAAATSARTSLPPLRPTASSRWRAVRRLALGVGVAAMLSTAAAATGVLERLGIILPPPVQRLVDDVSETVTGRAPHNAPAPAPDAAPGPVILKGPVDTPQELETAFRRADEVRAQRTALRRDLVDQRIDAELARRRAEGLPAPTPEQEAAMRQRLEDARDRRDALAGERRETVREGLRERAAAGEPIIRDVLREVREEAGLAPAGRLTPAQREALRRRLAGRRQSPLTEPQPQEVLPTVDQ